MSYSCSHWWHAPIYLTLSIVLAAIAISSFHQAPSTNSNTLTTTTTISVEAKTTLRNNNFTIMATLLQFSPQLFSIPSPSPPLNTVSATVFAIHDTAFSTVSAPPSAVQQLLQYHTLPTKLPFQELRTKANHSCLSTLIPSKNISLTKNDHVVMINNVTISHPDLFHDDFISIHGVLGMFTSLNHTTQHDFIIDSPCCDCNYNNKNFNQSLSNMNTSQNAVEWVRMIRALSSSGYISFAIGLNSVLGRVLHDNPGLGPVTVLAALDFGYVGSSNWILDRVVQYHVLSKRYNYTELAALPTRTRLSTLLTGNVVEVTINSNVSYGVAINGIEVVSPEVFSTTMFVVHGISRALDFLSHATT